MSHASGGLLATLPRYQSQARLEPSVWRLGPSGLEPAAVAAFLLHALPPEASVFHGVRRVPGPLPLVRRAAGAYSEDRLAELLLAALEHGVRRYVTAGTVVDVSLSGGVDSAALCAMAARQAPGRVRAWTMNVHFADETERRNARAVANASGVELVDIAIPDAVLPELFERAVLSQETAILNARAVASFAFYAEARRQGASTLLSGAGADEVLMGNPEALAGAAARVAEDRRMAREVLHPGIVDEVLMGNLGALAGAAARVAEDRRMARGVPPPGLVDEVLVGNPEALAGAAARVAEDRRMAREVLHPGLVDNLGVDQQVRALPWDTGDGAGEEDHSEEVRYAAWVLRELVLPPELRSAAAHGASVRTPYLDTGFAEVALGLPAAVLARHGAGKWLFRHAVRSLVPDEVRLARKTPRYAHTALSSPVRERWLALYREWLTAPGLAPLEVVDPVATRALLERYARLAPDAHEASAMDRLLMRLCSLAMLHAHALARPPCPES